MRYRRKPVERDVVDALKDLQEYIVKHADGKIEKVPSEEFERDYEPVKRERSAKPRKARKEKAATNG